MDSKGQLRYRLAGIDMVHYPDNDLLEITAPHIIFYRWTTPRWDVVAERARTNSTGDEIYLLGEVVIYQLGEDPEITMMKILTENVRVEPETKFAETSQPVTLFNRYGETYAVGARAYLQEGRIELLSQVRGDYEPPH